MSRIQPVLVIFVGPNGSGKSSIINIYLSQENIPSLYINADDITRRKVGQMGLTSIDETQLRIINIEAANEADLLRKEAIKAGKSFSTETVMSTPAKIDLMREAKVNGFLVHLVYVLTQDPLININRVDDRVFKGGHSVPPSKIAERYEKALGLLPEAIHVADTATVYNNSFEKPVILLEKTLENEIKLYPQNATGILSKWTQKKLE